MKRMVWIISMGLVLQSCLQNEKIMTISGNIDGLKKGLIYLQKIEDSTLTTIDSVEIYGNGFFSFKHKIAHPNLFYLFLDKADNNKFNDRIAFFGEEGSITIQTTWDNFEKDAEILGSKNHEVYAAYQKMLSNFNIRNLELTQASLTLKDSLQLDSITLLANRNYMSRYRYILNFGLTHPNSYVTPYVVSTDGSDANPKYLDSIYTLLPDSIANSQHGKILAEMAKRNYPD